MNAIPVEVWEFVLCCPEIKIKDLTNFQLVSNKLAANSLSPRVWKCKFEQSYYEIYENYGMDKMSLSHDWYSIYKLRFLTRRYVTSCLSILMPENTWSPSKYVDYDKFKALKNFDFDNKEVEIEWGVKFLISELRKIIGVNNEQEQRRRLTDRFYARQWVKFVVHKQLESPWIKWTHNTKDLFTGYILFCEWFQTDRHVNPKTLDHFVIGAVQLTKQRIATFYKQHKLVSIPLNQLPNVEYTPEERSRVIESLNYVFSAQLAFRGNTEDYYNINNSLWTTMIETRKGIPISLCVLYAIIAARLGIECFPVGYPLHFLLKYEQNPSTEEYTIIDVFNGCKIKSEHEIRSEFGRCSAAIQAFKAVTFTQVFVRMCINVYRFEAIDALELIDLMQSDDQMKVAIIDLYIKNDFNAKQAINLLSNVRQGLLSSEQSNSMMMNIQAVQHNANNRTESERKTRTDALKWGVGMVMRHGRYNYDCVIYSWDAQCAASAQWIQQMGVANLERGEHQPFYNVLVSDGSHRYVAEENLHLSPDGVNSSPITHKDIGQYFEEFCGSHYKMNQSVSHIYHQDQQFAMHKFM